MFKTVMLRRQGKRCFCTRFVQGDIFSEITRARLTENSNREPLVLGGARRSEWIAKPLAGCGGCFCSW